MMAKRRKSATKTITVRERVSPAPIRISVPRAAPIKAKGKSRRRRSHGGGSRGILSGSGASMTWQRSGALALGGFLYGYIEKNFGAQIPNVPLVGKSGGIAILAYMMGGKSPGLIADVGNAASVIAGYSFGSTGKVAGNLAPQVSGVAAQI